MPKSHIYTLYKGGKSGVPMTHAIGIIGSNHNLDFSALPDEQKLFIIREHNRLVVENKDIKKPFTIEELKELGFLDDGEDILGTLDPKIQELLLSKIGKFLEFKGSDSSIIKSLNYTGLHKLFEYAVNFEHGMDYELVRKFSQFGEVSGLESRGELKAYFKPETREEFLEFMASHLDPRADIFGSKFATEFYLKNLYLKKPDYDSEVLVARNEKWLPEIKSLPNDAIICVGMNHLYGENGLLMMLRRNGYDIYRVGDKSTLQPSDAELTEGIGRLATTEEQASIKSSALSDATDAVVRASQLGWQEPSNKEDAAGGAASSAHPSNDLQSNETGLVGAGSKEAGHEE